MSATLISLRIPFSSGAEARDICVRREFLQPHFRTFYQCGFVYS
jgi:hypothetical protein